MDIRLHDFLCDPNDGQPLQLHIFEARDERVREGVLLQPATGRWYPIHDALPSLFIDALRVGDEAARDAAFVARFESRLQQVGCRLQENAAAPQGTDFARIDRERRARDEQSEQYDRIFALQILNAFEKPAYRNALKKVLADNRARTPLLEAGCGTGHFTPLFAELSDEVVAADMSRDSIERNRVRCAGRTRGTVHYLHTDLTHLPLKTDTVNSVAHVGVYEHIPSRALREQFLAHARRVLRPEGALLLSAYSYYGVTKRFEKEGEHDGGIPFFRFTPEELRQEVAPYFAIETFRPTLGFYMSMLTARPAPAAS